MRHPDTLKNRDIVLFGFQPWEIQTGSNFIDMAYELAASNRVLYVNRAYNRFTIWKSRKDPAIQSHVQDIRKKKNSIKQINEQLWVLHPATVLESINWIPSAWLHDELNFFNNQRLAEEINKAIRALEFLQVILINDNDFIRGRFLKELVHCDDYIFYLRDYLLGIKYFQRHGPRLEAETIALSTLVAANSAPLAAYASRWNANSFNIGQGFRATSSGSAFVPEDIKNIKHPIIGYSGYVSDVRIDTGLLAYLAEQLPGCSIVLVGNTDPCFNTKALAHLPNVLFLGSKPFETLHNYIRCFDVCINPQKVNETTRGNYPRKIDEYLALGKPVVATRTEAMSIFAPYTYLVTSKPAYAAAIKEIISNPGRHASPEEQQRRMFFAGTHTWAQSIQQLGKAYLSVGGGRQRKVAGESITRTSSILRMLTIYFLIAYLLFIYIKFMFF